ncbi:universal stress protein [Actinospica sp. MGRD01-02]|uniref:Universal stress protein n=1 Tax=Actinospica acidithermotolerans TaxID=2828514 RepID=A0A941II26_9ACTN|nr:universal stress protein [Actinospica acidithermotolerans]MBR7827879.1 universal stress protein [Actinospica acidithermotolerans]
MESKIVGRVVVGVDGSLGSLEALRFAAAQARLLAAVLVPVLAWRSPGGALAGRRASSAHYNSVLREFAEGDLRRAFEEGLGGPPTDLPVQPWVIMGEPGPVLVQTANRQHDLLIVGAGRRGTIRHALHAGTARYCLAHATCPVIAVPPSPLHAALRSWRSRRQQINHVLDASARPGPLPLPPRSAKDR